MKKLLLIATGGLFLFTACKKSTTTPSTTTTPTTTTPTIPTDGWELDGVKHKQAYCLRQTNQFALNAVDALTGNISSFAAFFKAYPTTSGTYHIVLFSPDSTTTIPGSKIGANDVIIIASRPKTSGTDDDSYWSMGYDKKDATVTVGADGKLKIEIPQVMLTSGKNDTLKVMGTMIEN